MSNLINYEGFKIPQPTPANLGGEALANNFKWLSMTSTSHAYNDTLPVVGFTTQCDLSGNKMFERGLHAETRSSLYQPFDEKGYAQGGYDSVDRLRKALRGELSSDGGYTATGGGSITTPIALPNTDTSRDYDLDGLGNWKQTDYIPVGGTATIDLRQHNKLNEITSRKVGDDAKVLFAYDGTTGASNGNLADDGILELSYDALNRLIQVKRKSDGAIVGQYVYDASNRRVSKTISNGGLTGDVPNGTTNYLYQNWQVVEERNGSDTAIKQYVWGKYIDECIQLKTLTTTGPQSLPTGDYYPLQDLLYRTMALTDDDGDIVEAYDYNAYGNTLIFSAAGTDNNWWADDATQANYAACEVLFCGYRYDPELKLYQVRNREYSPTLGRWLQRDPIEFDGGDWNLYGYVESAPAEWLDPEGTKRNPNESRGACFWRSYPSYRGGRPHSFSHVKACESANQNCGSHIKCGPCGPYNLPSFPKIPCDPVGAEKFANFLRYECGGDPGGDKLGHCWLSCMASSCGGALGAAAWKIVVRKDSDSADTAAENKGISCGCQTYRSLSKYNSCMECCSQSVRGMIFD